MRVAYYENQLNSKHQSTFKVQQCHVFEFQYCHFKGYMRYLGHQIFKREILYAVLSLKVVQWGNRSPESVLNRSVTCSDLIYEYIILREPLRDIRNW